MKFQHKASRCDWFENLRSNRTVVQEIIHFYLLGVVAPTADWLYTSSSVISFVTRGRNHRIFIDQVNLLNTYNCDNPPQTLSLWFVAYIRFLSTLPDYQRSNYTSRQFLVTTRLWVIRHCSKFVGNISLQVSQLQQWHPTSWQKYLAKACKNSRPPSRRSSLTSSTCPLIIGWRNRLPP